MPGPGAYLAGNEEIDEVMDVLKTGYLSRYGDDSNPGFQQKVFRFEREFAARIGVAHAVAVSSGTGALMCALKALTIGPGDEVLVPGYTFIASISAIIEVGATPVLTEIDESLTMDPKDLESRITARTRAIMPVHMLGNPAAMEEILALARRRKIPVVEDCCQAVGGSYRGKRLGSLGDTGHTPSTSSRSSTPVTAGWWPRTARPCTSGPSATTTRDTCPCAKAWRSASGVASE